MSGPVLRIGVEGPADERTYLEALNVCFEGWGDRRRFDWCFKRSVAGLKPELLWLTYEDAPFAGSGIVYRRLSLTLGATVTAGIVCGAWTLPGARWPGGLTGPLTKLLNACRDRAQEQGAALLLAFGTGDNASHRRVRSAGAAVIPSWYVRSGAAHAGVPSCDDREIDDTDVEEFLCGAAGWARFVYDAREWHGQFLDRPGSPRAVRGDNWMAIVERTSEFDRVLTVAPGANLVAAVTALQARAAQAGRRLFCFTTSSRDAEQLAGLNFEATAGYLGLFIANEVRLRTALDVPGDVPSPASAWDLVDSRSSWFLGQWDVHNGDRM